MYVIRLHNCAFHARHGVLEAEKTLGQRFFVDIELTVDGREALETDRVDDTIHYGEAFRLVESIVTGERFDLIEALAYRVGMGLLAEFPKIRVAEVTVRKPAVPIEGILDGASVTVVVP